MFYERKAVSNIYRNT